MPYMKMPMSVIVLLVGLAASMAPGGHCWCWYLAQEFGQRAADSGVHVSSCCESRATENTGSDSAPADKDHDCCCDGHGKVFDVAQATTVAQQNLEYTMPAEAPATPAVLAFHARAPQAGLDTRPPPGRALHLLHGVFLL